MEPTYASRRRRPRFIFPRVPWVIWGALFCWGIFRGLPAPPASAASFATANFVVHTSDPRLAKQFAEAAENHRYRLAVAWLGFALPDWASPCVVTAHVGPHLGAGGATTFVFDRGEVFGWRMTVQGSAERIVDSVLPHEITHMIFASYFRRPIPRWADEGAATSVEHPAEQAKYYRMLCQYLRTGQTLPLDRLFALRQYPPNMLVLYAQGYALVDYLIRQKGRREFVAFLKTALETEDWEHALSTHYGYRGLPDFQRTWLVWLAQGGPGLGPPSDQPLLPPQSALVASSKKPRPEPNLVLHLRPEQPPPPLEPPNVIPAGPLVSVDGGLETLPALQPLVSTVGSGRGSFPENKGTELADPAAANFSPESAGQSPHTPQLAKNSERAQSRLERDLSHESFSGTSKRVQQSGASATEPFAPGSVRPPQNGSFTSVQLALPFAIETPRQQALK
ncbi:MAG: hypothetical protein NZ899_04225 [Thermoguttaceae bacterium]|nr:hypothetical protein [Thermoguttaceae bacterium]MDW8077658.1 hypothetical protein [Thermoguttaceae bacterium]